MTRSGFARLVHQGQRRRIMIFLTLLALTVLGGCGLPGTISTGGTLPPPKPLPTATPLPPVRFPQDEAQHSNLTEWWYYTGHFHSASGHEYGFELTFFQTLRGSLAPYYAAHYAISDISRGQFHYDQQVGFGSPSSIPPAGSTQGFHLTLNGWTASGLNGRDQLHATMSDYAIDLTLRDALPRPILHGGNGLITYGTAGYSYYYSRPLLLVNGTVNDHGTPVAVSGQAWMDHQWGNFLTVAGSGWDWYSIQLANHTEYMLYVIRDTQKRPVSTVGTYIAADGTSHEIPAANMRFEVLNRWTSPQTGGVYPSGWRVTISSPSASLTVTPALRDQELVTAQSTGVAYWEGAVRISGRANGAAVTGQGYVELTGYATLPSGTTTPGTTTP
ncbi:MAG TPA: lipocalin family protein [Ktedonobacterales bacterium]|nr:lipocalin family protein [Ktedonobacterales bacterium]